MPRLRSSFLEFYDPRVAAATVGVAWPLPLVRYDVIAAQAPLVGLALPPGLDASQLNLGVFSHDPAAGPEGFVYVEPCLLPYTVDLATGRVTLNPRRSAYVSETAEGVVHLGLHQHEYLWAVSTPLEVLSQPEPTVQLRYRSFTDGFGFSYADPGYYHQVRLPAWLLAPAITLATRVLTLSDGTRIELNERLEQTWTLTTDYLSPAQAEALALALRHDVVQFYDPATGLWDSYSQVGSLTLVPSPDMHLVRAQARLQLLGFTAVGQVGTTAGGDYGTDYGDDYHR